MSKTNYLCSYYFSPHFPSSTLKFLITSNLLKHVSKNLYYIKIKQQAKIENVINFLTSGIFWKNNILKMSNCKQVTMNVSFWLNIKINKQKKSLGYIQVVGKYTVKFEKSITLKTSIVKQFNFASSWRMTFVI